MKHTDFPLDAFKRDFKIIRNFTKMWNFAIFLKKHLNVDEWYTILPSNHNN